MKRYSFDQLKPYLKEEFVEYEKEYNYWIGPKHVLFINGQKVYFISRMASEDEFLVHYEEAKDEFISMNENFEIELFELTKIL